MVVLTHFRKILNWKIYQWKTLQHSPVAIDYFHFIITGAAVEKWWAVRRREMERRRERAWCGRVFAIEARDSKLRSGIGFLR
jgi:hypothetical protein